MGLKMVERIAANLRLEHEQELLPQEAGKHYAANLSM